MRKLLPVASALFIASFASSVIADDNYQGHRAGIGYSWTELSEISGGINRYSADYGDGIKIEYGYDFNRIVGLNVSYAQKNDWRNGKLDGSNFQVDSDIGYAFLLNGFDIKPYGAIGLSRINEKFTYNSGASDSSSETSLALGTGVRMGFDFGLYADLRANIVFTEHVDTEQYSFTVGYRF
ncbi:MAG: porin family protein [Photobacterium frigidiphilum]|uniref:porin family protein n=1 Tax=Photobacterium frigidiphilum TaxID=264736 RepID=UPI003002282D